MNRRFRLTNIGEYPDNLIAAINAYCKSSIEDACIIETPLNHDQKEGLRRSLLAVSEAQNQCLVLYFRKNYSTNEIATTLGVSKQCVGQRIKDAIKKLSRNPAHEQILLGENGHIEALAYRTVRDTKTIYDLNLSARARNALCRRMCSSAEDVIDITSSGELLNIRNIGDKTAQEIIEVVFNLTGVDYGGLYYEA